MKHEAHGTQQPRHISMIGEERVPRNEVIRSYSQLISVSLKLVALVVNGNMK
ncbi:MAG: hypothetical protein V9G16_07405 [Nitrosomonas sp.]